MTILEWATWLSLLSIVSASPPAVCSNAVTKYRISVITQVSTLTEINYSILTFTSPIVNTQYEPYTIYKHGVTVVSTLTPAPATNTCSAGGIITVTEATTQTVSICPITSQFDTSTTEQTSSGSLSVSESITNSIESTSQFSSPSGTFLPSSEEPTHATTAIETSALGSTQTFSETTSLGSEGTTQSVTITESSTPESTQTTLTGTASLGSGEPTQTTSTETVSEEPTDTDTASLSFGEPTQTAAAGTASLSFTDTDTISPISGEPTQTAAAGTASLSFTDTDTASPISGELTQSITTSEGPPSEPTDTFSFSSITNRATQSIFPSDSTETLLSFASSSNTKILSTSFLVSTESTTLQTTSNTQPFNEPTETPSISQSIVPETTSSLPSFPSYTCTAIPDVFSIVVYQDGQPLQYLTDQDIPGGDTEPYYGYQQLPLTTDMTRAAGFYTDDQDRFITNVTLNGNLTAVYAAVRVGALGNSIVQFYPANHLETDMKVYNVEVNPNCELALSLTGINDVNIMAECEGILAVLSSRYQISRGSACETVRLYAIPYSPQPLQTTASQTSTSSTTVTSLASASPTCALPPYFKITVNATGMPPQYLYDPNSIDDDALSFTTNRSNSLVFSLTPTGQLQFNVTDIFNRPVILVSEQDTQNAGNEAVFFTTATRFSELGYQPVVATINPDCSLSLLLPYDGANIIQRLYISLRIIYPRRLDQPQQFKQLALKHLLRARHFQYPSLRIYNSIADRDVVFHISGLELSLGIHHITLVPHYACLFRNGRYD
ncbi:hypothetical protein B7494_g2321 [Chlorociboria aeruginascens]|nr:hypothetical protein B7494_g2321 [Chlorociboria aeruginascens]